MTTQTPAPEARRKLVENERAKLTATYINGLALAVFAVGGLAPFIATLGIATEQHGFFSGALFLLAVCSFSSGALHLLARSRLGRLDP